MPLSPTATRDLLAQLGHQPKRFLGQNFLVDGNIVRKSLELAAVSAGDTVVEVGPGLGTLTTALLEAGAEVWAVEKDRVLHEHLAATLGPRFPGRLHLLEADAMEQPIAGLGAARAISGALPDFKIVANLPYAISTPWMDAILAGPLPSRLVLMLQREAAQRYAASPGTKLFGSISIFLQAAYDIAPGHKVAAGCFYPQPKIESYLLHLVRKPAPFVFPAPVKKIIRACFQQRRKQIGALLRNQVAAGAADWLAVLKGEGFSAQSRPEEIPVHLWIKLASGVQPAA